MAAPTTTRTVGTRGGGGRGRGRGGRGDSGRNGGRDGPVQWVPVYGHWRAPWTSATEPGLLSPRPAGQVGQAYPMMMSVPPITTMAPVQAPSYDTSGLAHALQAVSLHQPDNDWFLDTGATSHMTGHFGNISQYRSLSPQYSSHVIVGNGSTIPISGTGSSTLQTSSSSFLLKNILHTPNLVKNLISVRKFTTDNSCSIEFDPLGFSLKDLQTKKEIMRSNSCGDLYPFFGGNTLISSAFLATTSTSVDVWHQRLGHPGRHTMSTFFSQF